MLILIFAENVKRLSLPSLRLILVNRDLENREAKLPPVAAWRNVLRIGYFAVARSMLRNKL